MVCERAIQCNCFDFISFCLSIYIYIFFFSFKRPNGCYQFELRCNHLLSSFAFLIEFVVVSSVEIKFLNAQFSRFSDQKTGFDASASFVVRFEAVHTSKIRVNHIVHRVINCNRFIDRNCVVHFMILFLRPFIARCNSVLFRFVCLKYFTGKNGGIRNSSRIVTLC